MYFGRQQPHSNDSVGPPPVFGTDLAQVPYVPSVLLSGRGTRPAAGQRSPSMHRPDSSWLLNDQFTIREKNPPRQMLRPTGADITVSAINDRVVMMSGYACVLQ